MSDKKRYPREQAAAIAQLIGLILKPYCTRICIAGSIRRGKPDVGDIEIVYIPIKQRKQVDGDMFAEADVNIADEAIKVMEEIQLLSRRKNVNGSEVFGEKNKLMVCAEGIPVDLFATTEEAWFNYLTCRTGPAESNTEIATKAKDHGWQWNPYGEGFSHRASGEVRRITAEAQVFDFVRMPQPKPRVEVPL